MTTENSFSKLTHVHSAEVKLKYLHGVADILKEIFKYIAEGNLSEIRSLLENNEFAEKSLNITLSKAFMAYKPNNKESKDIIGVLLKYKADPNINLEHHVKHLTRDKKVSNAPFTALMYAASENDVYLSNILISYHCNVNIKDHMSRNALFYAILAGNTAEVSEIVNLLVNSRIDVNQIDSEGNSPLTLAVLKGLKEVIRVLLNNGADVDFQVAKDDNTALHYAVTYNKPDIIYLLLLKKPNLTLKNKSGITPIDLAFNLSTTEVYQILAEEFHQRESHSKKLEESNIINQLTYTNGNNTVNTSNNVNDSHNSNSNTDILIEESNLKDEEDLQNLKNNISPSSYHDTVSQSNITSQQKGMNTNNKYYNQNVGNFYPGCTAGTMNLMSSNFQYPNIQTSSGNFSRDYINLNNTINSGVYNSQPNLNTNSNINSNSLGSAPNINININNLTSHNSFSNRNSIPLTYKYSKNAKLQKLKYLQESRLYAEQTGRSIKDKTFKFPFGQSHGSTNIEIPFNFHTNSDKLNSGSQSGAKQSNKPNQLHTFIKIQSTPILHIDISDETKQDQFVLSSHIEELKITNSNQSKKMNQIETDFNMTMEENVSMKHELNRLKDELLNKDKLLYSLTNEFNTKEEQYVNTIEEIKIKLEDKNTNLQNICSRYEQMEKELIEIKTKENCSKSQSDLKGQKIETGIANKKEFLEKKFSCLKYDEKYIIKCLQKDISDFQEYTKEQIKKAKSTQEELIKLIQDAVDDVMPDYEVKLYGSHATNLCLQWSDLDVVLVHKRNYNASNYQFLQSLYINLLEKPWKKSIKLIDSAVVPIIKMTSTEQYNNMHIDISLQDSKHYGLKCVELVKSFMNEYEALEPLLFALKNILKNANLNDPYTGGLSSYGLILMVVSFLQSQQENKKSIKIADGNLGRMFLEFLWYYGLMFDHSKYVIYAFPTNENTPDKESINFLYSMQPSHELIIVDPLSKTNNVARSTYQFVNIKMAFMIGFVVSHEECECGCHFNKLGDEHSVYNSDHCILKRIFNSVKRFNASTQNS